MDERRILYRQLGFYPYVEYGCTGAPCTPCAENSSPDTWFDGALADQPKEISRNLFPHQLKSVGDMERFEKKEIVKLVSHNPLPSFAPCRSHRYGANEGHGAISINLNTRELSRSFGIQADPVGYGKTLSMITLIARNKMPWPTDVPYRKKRTVDNAMMSWTYETVHKRVNITLVLTSLSCIDQWEQELQYAPSLSYYVVKTKKKAKKLAEMINSNSFNGDVVLTSPNMCKEILRLNPGIAWKRFVFDEPANLRVPGMPYVIAGFIWLVTATPRSIYWHQGSNWIANTLKLCERGIMLFTVRNPLEFVKASFGMPPTVHREYFCCQPLARGLRGVVSRELLDRIEAGDIKGAIETLGGSSSSKDNLVEVIRKRKLRDKEYIVFHLNRATTDSSKKQWQDRLDGINAQLDQLSATAEEDLKGSCPICLDDLCEPLMEPNCGKLFCGECLLRWITVHASCPNCRHRVDGKQLIHVCDSSTTMETKEAEETKEKEKTLTKIECMEKIFKERLAENPEAKFILASQYSGGYFRIKRCLERLGIRFKEISGHASTRKRIIAEFQEGTIQVIFLGNLDSTAGVNLQAATDVIMFNNMCNSIRAQVIGRANRIGRKHELIVHTLKTSV